MAAHRVQIIYRTLLTVATLGGNVNVFPQQPEEQIYFQALLCVLLFLTSVNMKRANNPVT